MTGMTAEAAARVREHVWTKRMRATYAEVPGYFTHCACQGGPCGYCSSDRHGRCYGRPMPRPETYVVFETAVALAEVWLADRVCRWICPCATAGHGQPVDGKPLVEGDQFALFAIGA